MKTMKLTNARFLMYAIFALFGWGPTDTCAQLLEPQYSVDVDRHPVLDIFFLPKGEGWAVVSEGTREFLLKTEDLGDHWSQIPLSFPLQKLFFIDSQNGWGIELDGESYAIRATSDGGATWILVSHQIAGKNVMITDMLFTDLQHGWIIGTKAMGLSFVLQTTDSGKTFTTVGRMSGAFGLSRGIFARSETPKVWIVGNDSILHTEDAGRTWLSQINLVTRPGKRKSITFFGGSALEDQQIIAVGQSAGAVIFKSTDSGADWRLVKESEEAHWFTDIQFWDERHGFAVGASTLLFCSDDSGETWKARDVLPRSRSSSGFSKNVFDRILFASNGQRGWALAAGGTLFQTEDGGNSWRRFDPLVLPNSSTGGRTSAR